MDRPLQQWIYKTAHRNLWRVYPLLTFKELVQEGHLTYAKLKLHYPNVTEPRHMMALMATAFPRHIHNIADQRRRTISTWAIYDVEGLAEELEQQECDYSALLTFIAEAPPRVKDCLKVLLASDRQKEWQSEWRHYLNGQVETFNDRLCHLLGLQTTTDLRREILAYLREPVR